MGLSHLCRFLTPPGEARVAQIAQIIEADGFPLAIASINLTAILQSYLHLNPNVHASASAGVPSKCSERVLGAFLEISSREGLEGGGGGGVSVGGGVGGGGGVGASGVGASGVGAGADEPLDEIHRALLFHLTALWRSHRMRQPEATIMDFPPLLKAAQLRLHRVLHAAPEPWQLERISRKIEAGDSGGGGGGGSTAIAVAAIAVSAASFLLKISGYLTCGLGCGPLIAGICGERPSHAHKE